MLVRHRVLSLSIAIAGFAAGMSYGAGVLVSVALGVSLGLVIAVGLDSLDDTITKPEEISDRQHLPVLSQIPNAGRERTPLISGDVGSNFTDAFGVLSESIRFPPQLGPRLVLVTSAQPREGKTIVACNLALTCAARGARVLLVDAHLDHPAIHGVLDLAGPLGLSQVLMGQSRIRDAIQRTSDPSFCVMTAGPPPPDASEVVASERMTEFVTSLRQSPFDWVVIDSPALSTARDAATMSPLTDGVLLVVRAGRTRPSALDRALAGLDRMRILGAVLNRVKGQ